MAGTSALPLYFDREGLLTAPRISVKLDRRPLLPSLSCTALSVPQMRWLLGQMPLQVVASRMLRRAVLCFAAARHHCWHRERNLAASLARSQALTSQQAFALRAVEQADMRGADAQRSPTSKLLH